MRRGGRSLLTGQESEGTETTSSRDDRRHGHVERRAIRVTPADDTLFPGAAQAFRLRRDTGGLDGVMEHKEIVYGITSMPSILAGPAHLNYYERRHWHSDHRCRDRGRRHHHRCRHRHHG
jgi:hypothetical protein